MEKFKLKAVVIILLLFIGAILIGAHGTRSESTSQKSIYQKDTQREIVEGANKTEIVIPKPALAETSDSEPAVSKRTQEAKALFIRSIQDLKNFEGRIEGEEKRRSAYRELMRDPEVLRIAELTVSNLKSAQGFFGENQAQARVYSIELLEEAAHQGNRIPLQVAIQSTISDLQASGDQKGRLADLTDLIASWIRVIGKDKVENNPSLLFSQLQYRPSFRSPFATAIRYVYGSEKLEDPHFISQFQPFLKGERL